ncbi:lysozyme inhibitor LprI family protein [Corallibacter sp.]|uniref:lysozyme inhibitor LprI family protein n=1 Tax=Corallibacter sp. TaxID=2038084 RepID=UPI003A91B327
MKNILAFIILTLTFNCFSQTQTEMNQEAYDLFHEADKELNNVYNKILTTYKSDSIFIENLKKSQRIWIKFRDSELEMKYPNYKASYYGSSHPMCRAFYLKELTEERTKKLKVWLNGIEEGDMCSGSVKTN